MSEKNNQFFVITRKSFFQTKNFLCLSEKTNFLSLWIQLYYIVFVSLLFNFKRSQFTCWTQFTGITIDYSSNEKEQTWLFLFDYSNIKNNVLSGTDTFIPEETFEFGCTPYWYYVLATYCYNSASVVYNLFLDKLK